MAWIREIEPEDAPPDLASLYREVADPTTGELDNILKVHGLHPAGLRAHFELYRAVMRGTAGLSAAEREMIALVVSQRNACRY